HQIVWSGQPEEIVENRVRMSECSISKRPGLCWPDAGAIPVGSLDVAQLDQHDGIVDNAIGGTVDDRRVIEPDTERCGCACGGQRAIDGARLDLAITPHQGHTGRSVLRLHRFDEPSRSRTDHRRLVARVIWWFARG